MKFPSLARWRIPSSTTSRFLPILASTTWAISLLGELPQEVHRLRLLRPPRTQRFVALRRSCPRNLLPPYLALVLHPLVRLLLRLVPLDAVIAHELAVPNLHIATLLSIAEGLKGAGCFALLLEQALSRPRVCTWCKFFHAFFLHIPFSLALVAYPIRMRRSLMRIVFMKQLVAVRQIVKAWYRGAVTRGTSHMCGRRRPEIVVAVVRLVCCRRSLLVVFRRCSSAGLWRLGLGLRTVLLHRLPRGLQHGRIVPATRQLSAVPGLSAPLQCGDVIVPTIATQSSSSARAPRARLAHRAVYASVCPDMTGTAACILQNRASTVALLYRAAPPASRAASVNDASGANDASRRLCGRRLFEGSASAVICAFGLGLSARGGRYVRGGAVVSSPLLWWW